MSTMPVGTTNSGILAAVTTFKENRRWRLQIMAIALAAATLFASSLASAGAQDGIVNAVDAPIIDRGVDIEVTPLVTIPPDEFGQPRLNQFALQGDRLFVVTDLGGKIYEIEPDTPGVPSPATPSLWFDVGAAISATPGRGFDTTNAFHGGLRAVAFHPDFRSNGLFYTSVLEERVANPAASSYLSDVPNPAPAESVVVEWRVDPATGEPDPNSYREVFRVGFSLYEHPIKWLAFNPHTRPGGSDYGLLYVAHGDASSQPAPEGGGLRNDALGKIIRVDPTAQADGSSYGVPASNPFVGNPSMIDEAYAIGFRNPHNLSFAPDASGEVHLIVADVGRDNVEEINLVESGGNYGWSLREGTFIHRQDDGDLLDGVDPLPANEADLGFSFPAAQFGHVGQIGAGFPGQGIAGGFVVQNGSELDGEYFYSDFPGTGEVFSSNFEEMVAAVTRLDPNDPSRDEPSELTQAATGLVSVLSDHDRNLATPSEPRFDLRDVFNREVTADDSNRADVRFGQGPLGELYVSSKHNGTVYLVVNSVPPAMMCEGQIATVSGLIGTNGDDVIVGTSGPEFISGNGGNDVICGRGGADQIFGGPGDDIINAGWGADVVRGGDGEDLILGGPGFDDLEGGNGSDTIRGGNGGDRIVGGGAADTLYGGQGRDRLLGFAGNDRLFGGDGIDNLRGGAGADEATGGAGVDSCTDAQPVAGCEIVVN